MIRLRAIITNRWFNHWPTWQMVHEWEDVFSNCLQVPIVNGDENSFKSNNFSNNSEFDLFFIQLAQEFLTFPQNPQLIPIVMDVWGGEITEFSRHIHCHKLLFVTCLDAFHALRKHGCTNVAYLPYSVPDKYIRDHVPVKDIDIIQFGRTNPLLNAYMETLISKYPGINYVDTCNKDNRVYFKSNKHGVLGESDSRETFMNILSRSTISLVSTAGMDGSRDTGGLNPVSPRFFESAACFCRLVGRFPNNDEFKLSGINCIADKVDSYGEFETIVLNYLGKPFDKIDEYLQVLRLNTTSQRAALVQNALLNLGS